MAKKPKTRVLQGLGRLLSGSLGAPTPLPPVIKRIGGALADPPTPLPPVIKRIGGALADPPLPNISASEGARRFGKFISETREAAAGSSSPLTLTAKGRANFAGLIKRASTGEGEIKLRGPGGVAFATEGAGRTVLRLTSGLDLLNLFGDGTKNIERNLRKGIAKARARGASRAGAVNVSRTNQRQTSAINRLVSSGRKKVRSASVALPKSSAGGLLIPESRSLLL